MRVLVTGGAGFLGSHYVRSLLDDAVLTEWSRGSERTPPAEVVVLDKLTYAGNLANLEPVADDPRLRFVEGDVCDADLVDTLVAEVDVVVHFAAESHVDRSIEHAGDFVETNVVGTQTLLAAAVRHPVIRFVQVSTDEVYGSVVEGSSSEADPVRPSSPYSASKAAADLLALASHRTHGVPVCVTRGSNTYGPYQFPEKVVPLFLTRLLDGDEVPLYGDGSHVRGWMHVDDHARAVHLVACGGRPGAVYNIGAGTLLTNAELTRRLLERTGGTWAQVRSVPDRPGHDLRYSVDGSRIEAELGYRPLIPLEAGLDETVAWYRQHRDWWEPLTR